MRQNQNGCWVFPEVDFNRPRLILKINKTSLPGNDITFKYNLTAPFECESHNFIFSNVNDYILYANCDWITSPTNDNLCYVRCPTTKDTFLGTFGVLETAGKAQFSICSLEVQ